MSSILESNSYDAIVIGSGMSGGWAVKDLTERGLRTLLLERGHDVKHVTDYPTAMKNPWELPHNGQVPLDIKKANPVLGRHYIFREDTLHFLTQENEHPFVAERPFGWIRGYHTGGRSLLWARQAQRWSDFDFTGPARDGYAIDWPIRYADIARWYDRVEHFVGISGNKDGLPQLPDGKFLKPHEMSCIEKHFAQQMAKNYADRPVIIGRCANLTDPQPIHYQQGRGKCQNRNLCERGCPYGAYFSSNSSTIPWAMKTGKLTLRPHSVVHSIIYDDKKGKATGVRVIDNQTKEMTEFYAKIIFVNASTINTNLILLNSTSSRFPNGLGNDNGLLGTHIIFHSYRAQVSGDYEGYQDSITEGKRPNASYMPRFRNLHRQETDFLRGYAVTVSGRRANVRTSDAIGDDLKAQLLKPEPGLWQLSTGMAGETIPKITNHLRLDPTLKDPWGMPQLRISVGYDDNDMKMQQDFYTQLSEMLDKAGFKNIKTEDPNRPPGHANHEMGGARMGHDPKTSILNRWNQIHGCKNVFVTDGACMVTPSTQNPSLTYMAITARAVDYAVRQSKTKNL